MVLLTLIACEPDEPVKEDIFPQEPGPDIRVEPIALSFVAPLGGAPEVQKIRITNRGGATLHIAGMEFDSAEVSDVFDVTTIDSVASSDSVDIDVTFTPVVPGAVAGALSVLSDDPDRPEVVIALDGQVAAPELQLEPEISELGTLFLGCRVTEEVTLTNVGTLDLVVSDLTYVSAGADFGFDADEADNGPLPWTLAPSDSRAVYLTYEPLDELADEAILQVTSNDPLRPEATATQRGNAVIYAENIDTFEITPIALVDVLLVIDNSYGASEWEPRTVASAGPLLGALAGQDYQIAVITTDSPEFVADIITPATPDAEAALGDALAVGSGGGVEMPSEMAYQSLSGGDGAEFLRIGARFALVVISHSPDRSPTAWSDYLDHFQSLTDRPEEFITHAIAGDWPTGCANADATNTVYEMTVATGGMYLSICESSWDDHMESIVEETIREFELSDWPVSETVDVWLDGVRLESGWAYSEAENTINFDEGVLPEFGTIEVRYALFGECEG